MPEPALALYSLGIAPFFPSFLSNLLDTIGLLTKYIILHYLLLHNQPSFDQQLIFQADHEHFYFLAPIHVIMMIRILRMDRLTVGLRLPKLPILFAALWTIIFGRQFQTFVPAMSEERTIPM